MENIKIWHEPTEEPEVCEDIVFVPVMPDYPCVGTYENGVFYHHPDTPQMIGYTANKIRHWAYVSDLVTFVPDLMATSKALDVAIEFMKQGNNTIKNSGFPDEKNIYKEILQEIESIIKG